MESLISIPSELKMAIFKELSSRDLISLSETCTPLRAAALPLSYCSITMLWDFKAGDRAPKITSLLRTVLKKPSHAKMVKKLTFSALNYQPSRRPNHFETTRPQNHHRLDDDDHFLIGKAVEELCLPHPEEWIEAVTEKNDLGACMALIIARCLELQHLNIDIDFVFHNNKWLPLMLEHVIVPPVNATNSFTGFNKLTHFKVASNDDFPDVDLPRSLFVLPLYLPNITTLDLACTYELADCYRKDGGPTFVPNWPWSNPPNAANLTSLRLHSTSALCSTMEHVLQQTPKLKSLVIDCNQPSSRQWLDVSDLGAGLLHVCTTLLSLQVKYKAYPDEAVEVESASSALIGALAPLRYLSVLEDLELCLGLLYGIDVNPKDATPLAEVLPATLKRLTLRQDLAYYNCFHKWKPHRSEEMPAVPLIRSFISGDARIAVPKLEEFLLGPEWTWEWGSRNLALWQDFQALCKVQGIKLTMLQDEGEDEEEMQMRIRMNSLMD